MGRYWGQEAPLSPRRHLTALSGVRLLGVNTSGVRTQQVSCLILGPESVWDWTSRAGVRSEMKVQWEERELCGPPRNRPSAAVTRGSGECVERKSPAYKMGIKRSQVLCPVKLFNEERYDGIARKQS